MDTDNIEERLFSLVHHGDSNIQDHIEIPKYNVVTPIRLVTSKSVVNNAGEINRQSSNRYWVSERPLSNPNKINLSSTGLDLDKSSETTPVIPKKYVPYSSILSSMNLSSKNINDSSNKVKQKQQQKKSPNFEKNKKNQKVKVPKTKFINPLSKGGYYKLQQLHKTKTQTQKFKTEDVSKKPPTPKKIETISLDSSSENNDDDDDDVVAIELPPPPMIALDSSDESVISKKEFTQPNKVKQLKSKAGMVNSPRCISPSSNSMMSDDFIVNQDKTRLNEQFSSETTELELMQMQNTVETAKKRMSNTKNCEDKTLQEINIQLSKLSSESSSGQNTDRSSCEKEKNKEPEVEKSIVVSQTKSKSKPTSRKNSRDQDKEEDSIYDVKSKKGFRKRSSSNVASGVSSSDENDNIVLTKSKKRRRKSAGGRSSCNSAKTSGQSDSEKEGDPRLKLISSTPKEKELKKPVKKRQTWVSESYVDDDFNKMLLTIVQNPNPDDEEDSDDEDESMQDEAEPVSRIPSISSGASYHTVDKIGPSDSEEDKEPTEDQNPVVSVVEITDDTSQDCRIVENQVETITVDDDFPIFREDSNDDDGFRMTKTKETENCNFVLNVRRSEFEPHEYIKNYGKNKENTSTSQLTEDLENPEVGWNHQMQSFYHDSWGGETFQIKSELDKLPHNPKLWSIRRPDYISMHVDRRIKCHNCNEFGHMKSRCKRPRKKIICPMCGEEGHRETRCTRTLCLRCGKPNKIFTQGCVNCAKFVKKACPLCHIKGHEVAMCPDKWRRYHSTISDTGNLNEDVEYNTERVYCCICAKKGHWAEQCTSVNKTVSGITVPGSFRVNSYKPIYPVKLNLDRPTRPNAANQQVFNLYSYFENYEFNFANKISPGGFYSRIQSLQEKEVEKEARVKRSKKKRKKRGNAGDKDFAMEENFVFDPPATVSSNSQNFSFTNELRKIEGDKPFKLDFLTQPPCSIDKNLKITLDTSNNDRLVQVQDNCDAIASTSKEPEIPITEFETSDVEEPTGVSENNSDEEKSTTANDPKDLFSKSVLPDFISLGTEEPEPIEPTEPAPLIITKEYDTEEKTTSKILLTKNHSKILMSGTGNEFIKQIARKYSVDYEYSCDDVLGDFVLIKGYSSDQSLFQSELKDFLYRIEYDQYEKSCQLSTQIPKDRQRIIQYLNQNINSLKKHLRSPDEVYSEMLEAENSYDYKKVFKCRKLLNMVLLGQKGFGDGKKHLSALKIVLVGLQQDASAEKQVPKELRDDIFQHIRYIFSSEKRDYPRLLDQYFAEKKSNSLLLNPMSMIRENNRLVPIPCAPPAPKWDPTLAKDSQEDNPQPLKKCFVRIPELIKRCEILLSGLGHLDKNGKLAEVLTDFHQRIQLGTFGKTSAKKLKLFVKLLEEKCVTKKQ